MSVAVVVAAVLVFLAALAFFLLFRKLFAAPKPVDGSPEWWAGFSLEKYRPMDRLLCSEDYEFLSAQPGFSLAIARKLQAQRRRIFRHYLRCIGRDFDRLYTTTKLLMLHSAHDRPDLAITLLKQRLTFRYAMAMVHCRLALQGLGLGTVDVRGLVNALQAMRDQLRTLRPEWNPQPL